MKRRRLYSICFLFFIFGTVWGQKTVVKGKISDAATQEPVAFANIVFTGTNVGTTSDFDGNYVLESQEPVDSVTILFLGYRAQTLAIKRGVVQVLNVQLQPTDFKLDAIDILPGKNPAHRILDSLWLHRKQNDLRSLHSYQYESYTKLEVDVDNISSKFRNRAVMRPFAYLFDSLDIAAGEDGKPMLPVFVSETLSDFYCQYNPAQQKETIKATNVTGLGMDDGSYISQFVGSTFIDYNFYKNNLTLLEHNIISPISDEAIAFYIHILEDSLYIGNKWCYQIRVVPKRPQDAVFNGTLWIQDSTWALVKISVEISGNANINFVERLKIEQELEATEAGAWLPSKTRVLVDLKQPTNETFGMLAKIFISNKKVVVNQNYQPEVFKGKVSVDPQALQKSAEYWEANRHESLQPGDLKIYGLVDTIRNFPRVKSYIDIAKILTGGYIPISPKIEFGSYLLTYGTNVVEQNRFRVGLRSTGKFSKKVILKAYAAYGTKDDRFKYGLTAETFLDRKTWTKLGYQYKLDLEGLGAVDQFEDMSPMMEAATQLGLLSRMNWVNLHRLWFYTDIYKNVTQKVIFTTKSISPEGNYVFAYYPNLDNPNHIANTLQISELAIETRWAPLETKLVNDNQRTKLNVNKAPALTVRYTLGMKNVMGGNFDYHKLDIKVNQIARLGLFGRAEYIVNYNKIFTPLPYVLLSFYPGNQTFVRSLSTYNLMNFFEFVSDQSLMVFYVHHFDGLLMNRVPLANKLKWRLVLSGKMAMGGLSAKNLRYLPENDNFGNAVTPVNSLMPGKPYFEVGYGFENIFRFIRIQAYHRLSYTQNTKNNFGIKGSVYFNF
ncbi:carboxypeptidase-like regulatory domain-containing protein [bacterium]|nr:carboxypeptidase-like regulatory domain-containing protein [bacterium]